MSFRIYSVLQRDCETLEGREKLERINDMLMGKRLDVKSIAEMMNELGMADEKILDIIFNTRKGYLGRINARETTEEEFKQSIRATFSQDNACSLAEARFKGAGDSVELAVGAIKELMLVHETRRLGWKILHPIKNYRENAMISSLTERLKTEKNFKAEDIASNMISAKDTFSMNWGEGLSYDGEVISFAQENAKIFKASENKLFGVFEKAHVDFCDKHGIDMILIEETIDRVSVATDDREPLVIYEEDESKKESEASQEIVSEQPISEKNKML